MGRPCCIYASWASPRASAPIWEAKAWSWQYSSSLLSVIAAVSSFPAVWPEPALVSEAAAPVWAAAAPGEAQRPVGVMAWMVRPTAPAARAAAQAGKAPPMESAARVLVSAGMARQTGSAALASASAWTGPPMESAARESESWWAAQAPPTAKLQAGMALQSSPPLDRMVWQEWPASLRAWG